MRTEAETRADAYHEAGHAVALRVVGLSPESASIHPSARRDGDRIVFGVVWHREHDQAADGFAYAIALIGAGIAQAVFTTDGRADPMRYLGGSDRKALDETLTNLAAAAGRTRKQVLDAAYQAAHEIIAGNMAEVEAIAEALIERHHLDGAEIAAIIESTRKEKEQNHAESSSGEAAPLA